MGITHFGSDKQLEVLIVVRFLVADSDEEAIIFLIYLLLQNRINWRLQFFLHIFQKHRVSWFYGCFDCLKIVSFWKVNDLEMALFLMFLNPFIGLSLRVYE